VATRRVFSVKEVTSKDCTQIKRKEEKKAIRKSIAPYPWRPPPNAALQKLI
jgi:hypothetical protein